MIIFQYRNCGIHGSKNAKNIKSTFGKFRRKNRILSLNEVQESIPHKSNITRTNIFEGRISTISPNNSPNYKSPAPTGFFIPSQNSMEENGDQYKIIGM